MKKLLIPVLIALLFMTNAPSTANAHGSRPAREACLNAKVIKLKYAMQKLWIEHAWWTRSFIVSSISGLPDKDGVLKRLLDNQVDLGNIISPYYGEREGIKFTVLLKEYILTEGDIIKGAKKGDQQKVAMLDKKWHQNADQIVTFLSVLNPNWSKKALTDMFYYHLKLTMDEVVDRLQKDWASDIKAADLNETHLIKRGDFLTDGIVKQFPQKFK